MAVITRYIIVRNGVELDKVFDDKREADAYDKMLDAAESLAAFIKQGGLEIDLDQRTVDEISVFLAKNAPQVTQILKGIKPLTATTPAMEDNAPPMEAPVHMGEKPPRGRKAATKPKDQ